MAKIKIVPARRLATYKPHPHQVEFHQSTHKYRALVSGVGAGKTRMGVEECLKWSQLYPGSLGVIGRLTNTALKETTQRRFFECCDPKLIANFNRSDGHLWLKTNEVDDDGNPSYSEILFMHLDEPGPLGSLDISYFWIDEAHEPDGNAVPESTYDMLQARLRHPVGPHRGFVTSNSGGKDWVWGKFFNPGNRKRFFDHVGWNVPTTVNEAYLPEGYVEELTRTHSESWVKRFIEGSFDAFEGQVFPEFEEGYHTYKPSDVEVSPMWEHGVGFDFGVSSPTAAVYGAVDGDDRVYIYDEDYQADADISEFADKILARGFTSCIADPSVVNRGAGHKSPKQLYAESGVYLIPGEKDEDFFVSFMLQLIRTRLPDGKPKLMISNRCTHLIDQIKMAAWDPKSVSGATQDKMKRAENHALDALKYFLNGVAFSPGVLTPVDNNITMRKELVIDGHWEHGSFLDDLDFYDDNYVHTKIKEAVLSC